MSKEFIKKQKNKKDLQLAATQQEQLSYFTQSELQENYVNQAYLEAWAERNYAGSDYFLNYVKSVFKTENFLFFFKYLRKPLPSAKLINNKIKPQLNRVFVAENADYKYDVTGVDKSEIYETLNVNSFQEELFEHLLFNHNAILIHDLKEENEPYRYFINIEDVISLDHDNNKITKIAFPGCIEYEEKEVKGIVYLDDEYYSFYDKDYNLLLEVPHDLDMCPADFISKNKYKNNFIVRESLFTYIREELEEYNFLKTLQKMTEPNGAIPVVSKLDTGSNETDINGAQGEPASDEVMGSQKAQIYNENNNKQTGDLQAGTIHDIPLEGVMSDDGTINMDVVSNYLNFFYTPVEALEYLKDRISEVENSIISVLIGTIDTSNEESKNEMQIEKSIIVLENTLIWLAKSIDYIRKKSDTKMLGLKWGIDRVNEVFIYTGSDFFLESQSKLFEDLEKAPNPIERRNILIRINQNKYKSNKDQMIRQTLLYDLIPYTTDEDFKTAKELQADNITLQYYLRFNYWIGLFEAQYGDIIMFYSELDGDKSTKLKVINELIIQIIKSNTLLEDENNEKLSEKEIEDQRVKIEAQSKLKGTVGGVEGILGIQEKVSQGITSRDSAVKILNEIYGFDEQTASQLLGKQQIEQT